MVIDNILVNKSQALERCLKRITAEYDGDQTTLFNNITKQDSIVLNLQRACEISISLAMHVLRKRNLGIPQTSRDAFELLREDGIISSELCSAMKKMVGFRNIAVHEYHKLEISIVHSIIKDHLEDFRELIEALKKAAS